MVKHHYVEAIDKGGIICRDTNAWKVSSKLKQFGLLATGHRIRLVEKTVSRPLKVGNIIERTL
ncbi:MAG: hypothetical protein GJ680_18330 [Alteromonadaceae bacterium]|nr:hypothetical protein [Alteromonadaceae bacterium]